MPFYAWIGLYLFGFCVFAEILWKMHRGSAAYARGHTRYSWLIIISVAVWWPFLFVGLVITAICEANREKWGLW